MIKEKCVACITNLLAKTIRASPGEEQYEILRYGVELIYINLYKTVLLIIAAAWLGIIEEVFFFACVYGVLRTFAFGIHLDNGIACMIWGLINYIGSAYLSRILIINIPVMTVIVSAAVLLFFLYAPAGTQKRPIGAQERKQLKGTAIGILIILYFWAALLDSGYRVLFVLAVICETINILPVTYVLLKKQKGDIHEKNMQCNKKGV